jgi:hypothetical protein
VKRRVVQSGHRRPERFKVPRGVQRSPITEPGGAAVPARPPTLRRSRAPHSVGPLMPGRPGEQCRGSPEGSRRGGFRCGDAKELSRHRAEVAGALGRDRVLAIAEAVLLSIVALLAALSGYSAAQWGTHSAVSLADSDKARTQGSRADLVALQLRTFDSVSFNAAFAALVSEDKNALRVAVKRLRPEYRSVFAAWLATRPLTNPNAPPGPAYLPQYRIPEEARARALEARSDRSFEDGREAAESADKYVRLTVLLAVVLFLVGISSHFPIRGARYAFVAIGATIIAISVVELLSLGGPPG